MKIDNLSKEELVELKENIDDRLKFIETQRTKPQKETILSLEEGDKILGIRLSFGGHRMEEPKDLNGEVDIIDYCDVEGARFVDGNKFNIRISHPEEPFGIGTTLSKGEYPDEHCYLSIDTMKTGYDAFFTLKPETWKEDLQRMFEKKQKIIKSRFEEELKIYEDKLNLILDSEEKINQICLAD